VVLKILDDACLVDGDLHPDIRQRLARTRELAVPGIANLLSVERAGSRAYLVWDYIKGMSLADWLTTNPERSQRLLVARELVLIIESLHGMGMVHGSIHARNVFRDALGRLWVTHVSPLLAAEVQDDVDQLNDLIQSILNDTQFPRADSLQQLRLSLAGLIDARDVPVSEKTGIDQEYRRRRWMMISAIAVGGIGVLIAFAVWWQTRADSPLPNRSLEPVGEHANL
jgi:serine/threonine protein kinase